MNEEFYIGQIFDGKYPPMADVNEVWKNAVGFEDKFMVSSMGRVWSKSKNKIIKPQFNQNGYVVLHISTYAETGKHSHKLKLLHRIIAHTFLPNPENKQQINHKDGNKQNNNVKNLEWTTPSENTWHATHIIKTNKTPDNKGKRLSAEHKTKISAFLRGNNHTGKRVICLDNGRIFRSARHASLFTGKSEKYVSMCCRGILTKEHWQYL